MNVIPQLPSDGERLITEFEGQIVCEHLHRYAVAFQYISDKDVLDIACGEGYGSNLLSKKAKSVIGVDISELAIAHAKAKYIRNNLKYLHGSCTAIPLPDQSIDVAVSFETIEHFVEHDKFLRELKRIMRPDGVLIISSPDKVKDNGSGQGSNPFHLKELTHLEFRRLIEGGFKNSAFGKQLYHSGTIIEAETAAPIQKITGDYTENKYTMLGDDAVYSFGIASDAPIVKLQSSIYSCSNKERGGAEDQLIGCDLYVSSSGEFTQQKSRHAIYQSGGKRVIRFMEIEKHLTAGPVCLRFDPADRPSLIKILSFKRIEREACGTMLSEYAYDPNYDLLPNFHLIKRRHELGSFISTGNDPQFLVPVFNWDGITAITIEVELEAILTQDKLITIGLDFINKAQSDILEKIRELSQLQLLLDEEKRVTGELGREKLALVDELAQTRHVLVDNITKIKRIQDSLCWKLTAPLRAIRPIIKQGFHR
jgi:SAM-dependent methyltransferase